MAQRHAPIRYGAAALALADNLITRLKQKGLLTDAEAKQLIQDAVAGLRRAQDSSVRDAEHLLREMYEPPAK